MIRTNFQAKQVQILNKWLYTLNGFGGGGGGGGTVKQMAFCLQNLSYKYRVPNKDRTPDLVVMVNQSSSLAIT